MTFKNNNIYDHMRLCLAYLEEQSEPVGLTRLLYVCNNPKAGFPRAIRAMIQSGMIKKIPSNYKHGSYVITPKGHKALGLFTKLLEMIGKA